MDDYYAFIVAVDEQNEPRLQPAFRQLINEHYEIWYYRTTDVPPLSIADYAYSAIPKCYGLVNSTSLEVSGILRLQRQPTLSLMGQGVFVALIDTGIRYQDAAFLAEGGKSRIFSMWDQTAEQEAGDERDSLVIYGRTYSNEQINRALSAENPGEIVPETDENGHGTFLASVACGSTAAIDDFTGAAPQAQLIVVKLRDAGKPLRDFYAIPDTALAYAEHDIMAGIAYADRIAKKENRPLVIFLGLGTNHGGHTGTSPLCEYENTIAVTRHRAVVNAAGNEGNDRHHFFGMTKNVLMPTVAEVDVEKNMRGLWIELWAIAPEQIAVAVQSPTGEMAPKREPFSGQSGSYRFLFEGTELTIDYRSAGKNRRDQLVYLHFTNITKGIWMIKVYPEKIFTGRFHAWLPMRQLMSSEAFFLESSPDTTLTSPSDAQAPMTVGGYNAGTGALFFESGRGPDAAGQTKPDFVAPAVEVQGKGLRDNYATFSGTSAAAAITAGACAQILQWAVVEQNAIGINSVDIKNLLCRGARRDLGKEYPSNTFGYGELDAYAAFDTIRK